MLLLLETLAMLCAHTHMVAAVEPGPFHLKTDDTSPHVLFSASGGGPAICTGIPGSSACQGTWWIEGGPGDFNETLHDTFGPGTSLQFSFVGISIAVYGLLLPFGATASVTLDGTPAQSINATSPDTGTHQEALLFSMDDLKDDVSHTINITYDDSVFQADNHRVLAIDFFDVGVPDVVQPNTTIISTIMSTSSSIQPSVSTTSVSGSDSSFSAPESASLTSTPSQTGAPNFASRLISLPSGLPMLLLSCCAFANAVGIVT